MGTASSTIKAFFVELFGGILRWPVWWYTKGAVLTVQWAARSASNYQKTLALSVWVKNIFVPMYGTRDWQSRLISFFIRVAQIFARGVALVVWMLLLGLAVAVYLILPIVTVLALLFHIGGFFSS